jgi:CheY-like chemotaxis protein
MPFPLESQILVAISEPHSRARVREALREDQTPFTEGSPSSLVERRPERLALVIYDLAPLDSSALELLERARRNFPNVPFVLYPPAHTRTAQLLVEAARLGLVHALLQTGSTGDVQRLRQVIHRAFLEAPSARAFQAMDHVLGDAVDTKVRLFLTDVIRRVGPMETPPPTVAALARGLNLSRRSLERLWWGTGLPGPKQMIDWATLVTLTGVADAAGAPTSTMASRRGIDARRLHRLRRRLFGPKCPIPKKARAEHEALLVRFTRACMNRRVRWKNQQAKWRNRGPTVRYVSALSDVLA